MSALLERVELEARAREATAVHRLWVKIGELSGVEIELLETAYETFRERTLCAGAKLEVTPVKACWECPDCGRRIRLGEILRCADCARPARLIEGDEILLERIEMEVA